MTVWCVDLSDDRGWARLELANIVRELRDAELVRVANGRIRVQPDLGTELVELLRHNRDVVEVVMRPHP